MDFPMSGMGRGLSSSNSLVVSAFHHALWLQFLLVLAVVAALVALRGVLRTRQLNASAAGTAMNVGSEGSIAPDAAVVLVEPVARRVLRIGFGLIWLFDGILQGQQSMPLGMPSQVLQPAASTSPGWVQHLANFAVTMWIDHPGTAAAAAVWIQ